MVITLYHMDISTPCRAVLMTARTLGLDLHLKVVDLLAGDHLKPEFLRVNPQHVIPTLDDDGFIMMESRAICCYLVNKYGRGQDDPLYPKNPQKRALVDEKLQFDMNVFYRKYADYYVRIKPKELHVAVKLKRF